MKIKPNDPCPCHSERKYKKCCRPYHNGMNVPTPTTLVRARYSAYALGLVDFIMDTTHPDSPHYEERTVRWRAGLEAYVLRSQFGNLEILEAEGDTVKYTAHIESLTGYSADVTEECTFEQVDGQWRYLDGIVEQGEVNE